VICWRGPGEDSVMELDGMKILSYPYDLTTHSSLKHAIDYAKVIPLIRKANADVYISIDCMVETYIAQKIMPNSKHIIWVQDPFPYEKQDYVTLAKVDPLYKLHRFNLLKFGLTLSLCREAYKRADIILTQALYFYHYKLKRLFRIDRNKVIYLPNPVEYIPSEKSIRKSEKPLLCFLGRLDPVKRYWIVLGLAKEFPEIEFLIIGSPSLPIYEKLYRNIVKKYRVPDNLRLLGFLDGKEKTEVLSRSWILILPSIREALPLVFLEALAHKCALLSSVNPDGLTRRFGYWAQKDDFAKGLEWLLENNRWKILGEEGYKYVRENHNLEKIINELISQLKNLAENS